MFVAQSISDSVGLSAGTEQATEVGVSLEVTDGEEEKAADEDHGLSHLLIVSSPSGPSLEEEEEVGDVVGHLRSRSRGSVLIIDHSVVELSRHTNDHVIKVRIKVFSLGNFESIRRFEVIASHDVVDVVDTSWSHSDFGEVNRPHTSVGVLALIL